MTDTMKERAAKVAESYCDYARGQSSYDEGRSDAAAMIASAIRALPHRAHTGDRGMAKKISTDEILERRAIIEAIQELESRAHHVSMTITGRALNNAKNAAGWEMAGNINLAEKATRGER